MTIKEHKALQGVIDELVKECIEELVESIVSESMIIMEAKDPEGSKDSSKKKHIRGEVLRWLKTDVINNAEIMRRLWPGRKKYEDSKRSMFSKKVRGKDNTGKPYKFTDAEITRLYSIMTASKNA